MSCKMKIHIYVIYPKLTAVGVECGFSFLFSCIVPDVLIFQMFVMGSALRNKEEILLEAAKLPWVILLFPNVFNCRRIFARLLGVTKKFMTRVRANIVQLQMQFFILRKSHNNLSSIHVTKPIILVWCF